MTVTLQELKPSLIKPHKNNPRRDVGDVTELAASISEQGILEPLIVAPAYTEADTYVLIAGHRRLAAARKAKLAAVPCIVRADLTGNESAQLEAMLVENLQRTDLTPVEEAQAYQQLLEFPGYTQTKLAKATGRTAATIRGRLKLAALPKPTLTRIHDGQISLTEAQALVDFTDDQVTYKKLEKVAGTDDFHRTLKDAKGQRALARKVERATKKLADAGVRVLESQPSWQSPVTYLHGTKEVDAHRTCEGLCAFVRGHYNAYSDAAQVSVIYVCDRPDLHTDGHDYDSTIDREAERVARAELEAALAVDAAARRAWIRDHVLNDASEGLAVDMLRQNAHRRVKEYNVRTGVAADVLGCDKTPQAIAKRIDELDLRQLAVLLDVLHNSPDEERLEKSEGWGLGGALGGYSNARKWRDRLATLYGYTWSEHEQQVLDQAAAEAAAAEDDEDDGDEVPDFDDNPDWTEE